MSHARLARILSVVFLLMMLPASVMWGQEAPAKTLTLEEAVSLARSHNRELKQAGLEIHKQKEAFGEAKTHLYPRFDTYVLESQRALLVYVEELQQLTGRRLHQEAVLKADSLRITAQRSKALYQLTVIQNALADQKEALNHLLGRDLQAEVTVEMVPASLPEESSLQEARKSATEKRPEIKAET